MTYEELFFSAIECAKAAKEQAHRHDGEKASEAWSRAGGLFLMLAEHRYSLDALRAEMSPPPAPRG